MKIWTRRKFCVSAVAGGFAASASRALGGIAPNGGKEVSNGAAGNAGGEFAAATLRQSATPAGKRPCIISAYNGLHHLDAGMQVLRTTGDTMDAVLAVVTPVEDDPNDHSVGYGGLPNEDGVVQLDACVMHGPTRKCGAVGALERVKNAASVARVIMERTNHVFLVGQGATQFAIDEGFEPMNLLTDESRIAWLAWKAQSSKNWRAGLDSPEFNKQLAELLDTPERQAWAPWIRQVVAHPPTGTTNCLALNEKGEMSGVTTTSGTAWKISGRCGDSPIIGAGLFLDQDVGGAGSTGRGEENIRIAGGHTIVEIMRQGKSPTDACAEALDRVVRNYAFDKTRLRMFDLQFYAMNKDGVYGAASLWSVHADGSPIGYAVHDGTEAREVRCKAMFEGSGGDY